MINVRLSGIDDAMTALRIDTQLTTLIKTRIHTLPGSLDFGLEGNFQDETPTFAGPRFTLELSTAVDEFIPMISVDDIEFTADADGNMEMSVHVEWRDGYDRTTGKPTRYYVY